MRFAAPASAIIQYEKQKKRICGACFGQNHSLPKHAAQIPAHMREVHSRTHPVFFLSQRTPLGVLTKPVSQHPILSR